MCYDIVNETSARRIKQTIFFSTQFRIINYNVKSYIIFLVHKNRKILNIKFMEIT